MFISSEEKRTFSRRFLDPTNSTHRQYEALRGFFVDGLTGRQAAARFGYSYGSVRGLVHQFRQHPDRAFFLPPGLAAGLTPPSDPHRGRVVALRKQNLSIYDISRILTAENQPLSPVAIASLLRREGFARLPRRRDDERPATPRPVLADIADARRLDLSDRTFHTHIGGLFLFLQDLVACGLDRLLDHAGFPGTEMVPAGAAMRSLLALKLFANARHSHVMTHVLDEGLALFAGLNVVPKRSFLTEYSCRIRPSCHPILMAEWLDAIRGRGLQSGGSFDLDFHTIPFHGEDALVEKHYVSKRSRRQKGLLAFLAQDAHHHLFCYANADLRKQQQSDEILRFVEFWRRRTGRRPEDLIFD
ncbi:MAG: hypothetical protein ABSA30_13470, partial [Candidatus Aminicenantales bacterium]